MNSSLHSTCLRFMLALPLVSVVLACTSGCTTRTQVFDGHSDDQLWTAMVATARAPSYDDWKVYENEVYVDDASRRIEIYRVLKRTYVTPFSDPRKEEEEWRFQIMLARDEELNEPMVDFTARQIEIPAHVWNEADRYFAQMRVLLGPARAPSEVIPAEIDVVPMPPPLDEEPVVAPVAPAPPATPEPAAAPTQEPAMEPLPE